ncbi:serine hydrolase domain-containing protein, partial [Paenibacillus gorillae]|uniref:serine hydrolase domain-containing protein n=1 Tax=Paenibacillus gorillae TaxID=1243662 RepID=UPI000694AA44
ASYKKNNVPGIAFSIVRTGESPQLHFYGLADKSSKLYVDKYTQFQVASISKPVTAWGIMKLVEEGALNLDKPITTYLKRWELSPSPFDQSAITVRKLLSHTAGINAPQYLGSEKEKHLDSIVDSMYGKINSKEKLKLINDPGKSFLYSSGGYSILQLLIEEVSGLEFTEYMEKNVLGPLSMVGSTFKQRLENFKGGSRAYDSLGKKLPNYIFIEKAAAGLYSNIEDMSKFLLINLNMSREMKSNEGGLINHESVKLLHSRVERTIPYGLGFSISTINNHKVISHTGCNRGWSSVIAMIPKRDEGIVILTNSNTGGNFIYDVMKVWMESIIGEVPDSYLKMINVTRYSRVKIFLLENMHGLMKQ